MSTQFEKAISPPENGRSRDLVAGDVTLPLPVRPSRTNFDPICVFAYSTVSGATFDVQISPTNQENDWFTLATITANIATADGRFAVAYEVDILSERLRLGINGAGTCQAYLVPGA